MRAVGATPWTFRSYNTCEHQGRVFNFFPRSGRLRVTEVLLGESVRCRDVLTAAKCKVPYDFNIACCSMGGYILLLAGQGRRSFAFRIEVDGGELSLSTVHLAKLKLRMKRKWPSWAYLCPISEDRALLCFHWQDGMWCCEVREGALSMRLLATEMPTGRGFETVPIPVPGGRLLAAGAFPYSRDITLITPGDGLAFEKIGEIPGLARDVTSLVSFGQRFVLGFGGWNNTSAHLGDLWVFDLETRRSSSVRKRGQWPPGGELVPLAVRDATLYLIGRSIHSLALPALAPLISSPILRSAFCGWLGIPFRPKRMPWSAVLQYWVSVTL